jgi:prepilin-type N-terminal cleavage/methylation domain-containing protein
MQASRRDERRPRRSAGFTLIEVLVGLSMAAFLLAAIHGLFASATRRGELVWSSEQGRAAIGTLAEMLARDLTGTCATGSEDAPLTLERGTNGVKFTLMTATRGIRMPSAQQPALSRVSYRTARKGAEGTQALWRSEQPFFADADETGPETMLTDALAAFEVSVFDGAAWTDEWPPEDEPAVPSAVRIRIGLAEGPRVQQTVVVRPLELAALPGRAEPGREREEAR